MRVNHELRCGARAVAPVVVALLAAACAAHRPTLAGVDANSTPRPISTLNQQIVSAAATSSVATDYNIGAEDLLEVTLFDIQAEKGEPQRVPVRVSQSGVVNLPLVGRVQAGGLTVERLEESLRERYKRFIRDPQVTVFVKEYRSYRVSVVGYVEKAGIIEISGEKTLLEVLALAGGLNKEAGKTVQLTRQTAEGGRTFVIDLDRLARGGDTRLNVPIRSGDIVNVPKAGVFYVEGSVKKPGAYPLLEEVTITQALATAGGADESLSKLSGTTLFRKLPNGDREAIPIQLAAIRAGKANDILIAENDVILVPMSGVKWLVDRFIGSIGMGLAIPAF